MFETTPRENCLSCRCSRITCYCHLIRSFESEPSFVLLMHPKEGRKRIGTARMTKLCISNARLIEGVDFSNEPRVNALLEDPRFYPVVLYPPTPQRASVDLAVDGARLSAELLAQNKKLLVFVIDGTWPSARKILRLSTNLAALPRVSFPAIKPSAYQIRRQPSVECLSSIEAVHAVIEYWSPHSERKASGHDRLLEVFQWMVTEQLKYSKARTAEF